MSELLPTTLPCRSLTTHENLSSARRTRSTDLLTPIEVMNA